MRGLERRETKVVEAPDETQRTFSKMHDPSIAPTGVVGYQASTSDNSSTLIAIRMEMNMQRPIESNTPLTANRRSLPNNPTQLPPGSETASPKLKKDAQNILRQLTRIMSRLEIDEEYEHQLQMIET